MSKFIIDDEIAEYVAFEIGLIMQNRKFPLSHAVKCSFQNVVDMFSLTERTDGNVVSENPNRSLDDVWSEIQKLKDMVSSITSNESVTETLGINTEN